VTENNFEVPPLLLFADDGNPPADVAWAWLTSHVWTGWRLETVTVHETLFPGGPATGDARFVPRDPPHEASFTSAGHAEIEGGDPRVWLSRREDASLMLVGSHHRGHLAGMLAGSTTEWLLVVPPVPLVVVRHGHRTDSIGVCIDGSAHALAALRALLRTPWAADAEITLIAVADDASDVDAALAQAQEELAPSVRAPEIRLVGEPRKVLVALQEERGFDLLVLGTRGLTGLARATTGSTVSALVKEGGANLLLAHARD
jgi:nucleotide-binding universal stress UspA family protein